MQQCQVVWKGTSGDQEPQVRRFQVVKLSPLKLISQSALSENVRQLHVRCRPKGPPASSCPGAHQPSRGRELARSVLQSTPMPLLLAERNISSHSLSSDNSSLKGLVARLIRQGFCRVSWRGRSHAWGAQLSMRPPLIKNPTLYFIACSLLLLLITAWSTRRGSPDGLGRKDLKSSKQLLNRAEVLCVVGVQVTPVPSTALFAFTSSDVLT